MPEVTPSTRESFASALIGCELGVVDEENGVCVAVVVAVAEPEDVALFVAEDLADDVVDEVDEAVALEVDEEVAVKVLVDVAKFDALADIVDVAVITATEVDVSVLVADLVAVLVGSAE